MEELSSGRGTGKLLNLNLKATGFQKINEFAQGAHLTGSFAKNQKLARNSPERLAQKWEAAYGEDFPQLLEDLRAGRRSDLVDSLLWSELADAQPISKMEMAPAYNRHPNGRLLYQLKTYMQTQADVVRRDVVQEMAKGTREGITRGLKNAAAFATVLAASTVPGDVIKGWLSGVPLELDDISYVENLLKTFGINRYAEGQISKGKPLEVVRDMVVPPFKQYQDIAKMDAKSVKYIPIVGKPIYDRALGGKEEAELRKIREKRQARLAADPAHQAKMKARRVLREQRMKDPQWREYYRQRALGNQARRPDR